MTTTTPRRLAIAAVLAASALALTGCSMPAALTPDAARSSVHELTAKDFAATLAAAQKNARTFHESLQASSGKTTLSIRADVSEGAPGFAMRETVQVTGKPQTEVIVSSGKVWARSAKLTGGAWAASSLSQVAASLGLAPAALGTTGQAPAAAAFRAQAGAVAYTQTSGSQVQVDGVWAAPYVVAIDTAAADAFVAPLAAVAGTLPEQLDYDWWIGQDDLPRRYTVITGAASEDVTFTGWNQQIRIVTPAPAVTTAAVYLTPAPMRSDVGGRLG